MKIEFEPSDNPVMTVEGFADKHGLVMRIREYTERKPPFCASFKCCEVKEGSVLGSEYGEGETPEEAIKDYAKKISGRHLVYLPYSDTERKDLFVPFLGGSLTEDERYICRDCGAERILYVNKSGVITDMHCKFHR